MTTSNDYPRMLFHRTKEPVTVQSREEEDALGEGWSRTIWQEQDPAPIPEPKPGPTLTQEDYKRWTAARNARKIPEPEPEPELLAPEDAAPKEEASAFEPQPKHHKPTRKHR